MAQLPPQGEQDRFQRYFATLQLIPRQPQQITAPEILQRLLSQGYGVSLRTVQRDLEKLAGQFALICDDQIRPQGWSWLKIADVQDIPRISRHTALTFKLVQQHLQAALPPATMGFLEPYFAAADRALHQPNAALLADWANRVRLIGRGPMLIPPRITESTHDAVYRALLEQRTLEVSYTKLGGHEAKHYIVHPQGLAVRDGVIYLVCVFDGYDNLRQLALHRIQSAQVGIKDADLQTDFDIDEYIAKGEFGTSHGQLIQLKCRFRLPHAQHLLETPLTKDQRIESDSENSFILNACVPWTAELIRWLLGWGDTAEVLGPEPVREEIEQKICAMYARISAS